MAVMGILILISAISGRRTLGLGSDSCYIIHTNYVVTAAVRAVVPHSDNDGDTVALMIQNPSLDLEALPFMDRRPFTG